MPPVTGTLAPVKVIKLAKGRDIIHPNLTVCGIPIPRDKLKVTASDMAEILGWETEAEYAARMAKENPGTKPERWKFEAAHFKALTTKLGLEVITDEAGNQAIMWNNLGNRKLRMGFVLKVAQDILSGCWKFNGESVIIGKSGIAMSVQHRGVALLFAVQRWRKNPELYPAWKEEPWIETVVTRGIDETPDTIQTLDNNLARTEADIIYTSETFAGLSSREKDECSRMLAKATDTLWDRVGAGNVGDQVVYRTNSETQSFRNRHEKLVECVKHLHEVNSKEGRQISGPPLQLSPGTSAALCYLMGCSASDGKAYRAGDPRSEDSLDWKHWKKALEFWQRVGDKDAAELSTVRAAIKELHKVEASSRMLFAVIALAWPKFLEGVKPSAKDLALETKINKSGKEVLTSRSDVGGIDLGLDGEAEDDVEVPAEEKELTELEKARIRREQAEAAVAKLRKNGVEPEPAKSLKEETAEILAKRKAAFGKDGKPPAPKLLAAPLHKRPDPPPPRMANPPKPNEGSRQAKLLAAQKKK